MIFTNTLCSLMRLLKSETRTRSSRQVFFLRERGKESLLVRIQSATCQALNLVRIDWGGATAASPYMTKECHRRRQTSTHVRRTRERPCRLASVKKRKQAKFRQNTGRQLFLRAQPNVLAQRALHWPLPLHHCGLHLVALCHRRAPGTPRWCQGLAAQPQKREALRPQPHIFVRLELAAAPPCQSHGS